MRRIKFNKFIRFVTIRFTGFLKNLNNNFLGNSSQKSTTIWDLQSKKGTYSHQENDKKRSMGKNTPHINVF